MNPAPTPTETPAPRGLLPALLLLVLLAHLPALNGGFVWDDLPLLRDRPDLHRLDTALPAALSDFFPGQGGAAGGGYLRPVPVLLNALTWQITDGAPLAFRLTNLALHLGSVAMLFGLLRRLGLGAWGAALAAAIFGLHPAQTEAVDFVSGRTDLLAAFFGLAALHGLHRGTPRALAGAGVAFLLALGSKEVALGLLPVALLVAPDARARWRGGAVLGAVAVALLAARASSGVPTPGRLFFGAGDVPVAVPSLAGFYVRLALAPLDLRAVYALPGVASPGLDTLLGAGLLLALAAGTLRGTALVRLGCVWVGACLLPVLHVLPLSTLVAPRYLYLPLAGAGLLLACAAARVPERWRRGFALAPALCLVLTPVRAADWRTEATLWSAELDAEPSSFTAHQNLGATLAEAGDRAGALDHLRAAAALRPEHALLRRNLIRLEALDLPAAVRVGVLRAALSERPDAESLRAAAAVCAENGAPALAERLRAMATAAAH
jgi:hypothetical protein